MDEKIELEYYKAPMSKRTFAFFFDFICMAILALGFFVAGRSILEGSEFYTSAFDTYVTLSRDSHLYVYEEADDHLVTITEYASVTFDEKKEEQVSFLEERLSAFYVEDPLSIFDGHGQDVYNAHKVGESAILRENKLPYFALNSASIPEAIVSSEELLPFYQEAMLLAQGHLGDSDEYATASQTLSKAYNLYIIPSSIALSFIVFEFLVPLIFFRRGYATLGMKTFKLALLTSGAVSPKFPRFLGRFAWMLIVEVLASMMTFGVPLFLNVGMAFIRKDGQALHDYMAGTYMVDASDQSVYFSKEEYLKLKAKAEATESRPYLSSWKGDQLEDTMPPIAPDEDLSSIEERNENPYNGSHE